MTLTHSVTITLDDQCRTYTADFQTGERYAKSWQAVLKRAYKAAEVRCTCRGRGEKRLAVKYLAGSDQFFLARFGLSGAQHSVDCQYSSDDIAGGAGVGQAAGVVDVQRDGSVKIRLEIGLTMRDQVVPGQSERETKPRIASPGQAAIRLGGLLGYLWDAATLNQWRPFWEGRRNIRTVARRLLEIAANVNVGDVPLAEQLLLPAMRAEEVEASRNRDKVAAAIASKRRMVIVAPLASYSQEREERMAKELKIAGFHGMPRVFLSDGQWQRLEKRYQATVAGWHAGHATVVIAQIEVWQKEGWHAAAMVDASLMGVTAQWIPVESSFEREIANRLVAEGRSFYKPLRFNPDDGEVHPDFVLLDCERGEVPLEVFGRTDEAYVARKKEKVDHYNRQFGPSGWWAWDATQRDALKKIPPFPAAQSKAADAKK